MVKRGLEHRHFIAVSKRDGLRELIAETNSIALRKSLQSDMRELGAEAKQLLRIRNRSHAVQGIARRLRLSKESSIDERKVFDVFLRDLIKNFNGRQYVLEHGLMNLDLQRKTTAVEVSASGDLYVFERVKGTKRNRRILVSGFAEKMFEQEISGFADKIYAKAQRIFKVKKKKK